MPPSKLQGHPSLPAPVVHVGFSVPQSKSHVLAGVQDAYWSDEEADDAECPLCLEEMDISDLNFKPCVCGYQICRFCWHHIKENLNKRCPACRRVYTDETVEFTAVDPEDHKKLTQQKKQRDRERKELEELGRRQLANLRVVQRNVVYVVGIGPRFAKEELIPTLRSQEYFGQYGKISKILLTKRTLAGGGSPVVGLYITYHRREDAARAISAVDGTASPGGGGKDLMRASYGTTKYCMAFLRSVVCTDNNCRNLHEWGDEKDCFTKEDLTTLKHTMKVTEGRAARPSKESDGLPRSAAWASKNANFPSLPSSSASARSTNRRGGRGQTSRATNHPTEPRPSPAKSHKAVVSAATKVTSQSTSSQPTTPPSIPQVPATSGETKAKHKKAVSVQKQPVLPAQSPAPSSAAESDRGSVPPESTSPTPQTLDGPPPGLPAAPPGLSPPPGLTPPPGLVMPPRMDSASPQTPILQPNYQMSNLARGLLDDLTTRRTQGEPSQISPFPDLEHTLQILSGDGGSFGGFGFSLDPQLAVAEEELPSIPIVDLEADPEVDLPFNGSFLDAFPAVRTSGISSPFAAPPGIPYTHNPSRAIYDPQSIRSTPPALERQSTGGSTSYIGSFNPFGDSNDSSAISSSPGSVDDDRRVSRFGFARGRRGSNITASPSHIPSPLSNPSSESPYFIPGANDVSSNMAQWNARPEYGVYPNHPPSTNPSNVSSPLVHQAIAAQAPPLPPSANAARFQPYDQNPGVVSEAQLRDFIHSSRTTNSMPQHHTNEPPQASLYKPVTYSRFSDPAIMSAGYTPSPQQPPMPAYQHQMDPSQVNYGPPPGLASYPHPGVNGVESHHGNTTLNIVASPTNIVTQPPSSSILLEPTPPPPPPPLAVEEDSGPSLSPSDFPALSLAAPVPAPPTSSSTAPAPDVVRSPPNAEAVPVITSDQQIQQKADRKAVKMAAAAERARISGEKAAVKAAEKEKEKAAKAIAKEKIEKEKAEKEKAAKVKLERERVAAQEKLKVESMAREKQLLRDREVRDAERVKEKERATAAVAAKKTKQQQQAEAAQKAKRQAVPTDKAVVATTAHKELELQSPGPLLSKKPKKNKPNTKPIKVHNQEPTTRNQADESYTLPSTTTSDAPPLPSAKGGTSTPSSENSRSQSLERDNPPTSLQDLFEELNLINPQMDLSSHPFFDLSKINPEAEMPVEYAPLVHALSALSVSGTFGGSIPTGSMDNAVTNFQQLLETLTNTISDLLHLLPRTTWDDNSSFNGSLQDMMKGEEALDVAGEDGNREDDVAALTLALERRARWMEIQLSKLEELHRDINTAAVRAVLTFNDHGWDRREFLPHGSGALKRFDALGHIIDEKSGVVTAIGSKELEKKLVVAKEAAAFAEIELRDIMERMQVIKPMDDL